MKEIKIDEIGLINEIKSCKEKRLEYMKKKNIAMQYYFHGRIILLKEMLENLK